MKIEAWYSDNIDTRLSGRYITLEHINPLLKEYKNTFEISSLGQSELGKNISMLKIGKGNKRVLAWSQMHGNESTTTKAIFDFLKFIQQKDLFQEEIRAFLDNYTLYIIPILNPDGAELYTRENSNLVDLNRDAQDLSQKESKILKDAFTSLNPDLCLNLHGQRTIFGLENGLPATVSFLSPAANSERELVPSRLEAMKHIVKMNKYLQEYIPSQIGRYDDSFNSNCFGDYFQMNDVPVILFEAGHNMDDYSRAKTREYIFYAFLSLFDIVKTVDGDEYDYFAIPENKKNYKDILLRNIRFHDNDMPFSIAIQYKEVLIKGMIEFIPKIESKGDLSDVYGHLEIQGNGKVVLVNSQNNVNIGDDVLSITNNKDDSLIYFNGNGIINKYN